MMEKLFPGCPMHRRTKFPLLTCLTITLATASCTWAASNGKFIELQTGDSASVDHLTIAPAQTKEANTIVIRFVHKEGLAACGFALEAKATRLPQRGAPDDFNEAMPDGSYVRVANYRAQIESIQELSLDTSSKQPRFASITVKIPTGYDTKKCKHSGAALDVLFFAK